MSWSPAVDDAWSISQSIQASTSSRRGDPSGDGVPADALRTCRPPWRRTRRDSSSWSSARMLTQNRPASLDARPAGRRLPAQKPTSGGSSEIEKNEPTARPTGGRPSAAVTTVTPVGKCPSTWRKRAESKAGSDMGSLVSWVRRSTDRHPRSRTTRVVPMLSERTTGLGERGVDRGTETDREALGGGDHLGHAVPAPSALRRAERAGRRPRRRGTGRGGTARGAWPRPPPRPAPRSRRCSGPSRTSPRTRAGSYCASWISRSAPSHSSSTGVGDVVAVDGLLVVADVGDDARRRSRRGSRWWRPTWGTSRTVTLARPHCELGVGRVVEA